MTVVQLKRCDGCGKPGVDRSLGYPGVEVLAFVGCAECYGIELRYVKRFEPVWNAMRHVGVKKALAEAIIRGIVREMK